MSAAALDRAPAPPDLLGAILDEQGELTAVERFARRHADVAPAAPLYEDLLPAAGPGPGEQYAFRVDLDACTGCKACVTACHSLNGLEEGETWRRVGLLVGEACGTAVQQTVTGACHHCEDPGCLRGCPVQAYEKDAVTGIVRHLDDQCIGCQYCTLTCPYEVPQYSERLGIVRKCDLCTGRLAAGEAPACVQGCPNGAISIAVVPRATAAPPPSLLPTRAGSLAPAGTTRPTTRYAGGAGDALRPADASTLRPAAAHWPLAALLVGTQLSVGLALVAAVGVAAGLGAGPVLVWTLLAWLAVAVAQVASIAHLGRPGLFFRAVLGWRTSWMSREALALGAYTGALGLALLGRAVAFAVPTADLALVDALASLAGLAAGGLGVFAVASQVMIYAVTGRPAWSAARTALRFAGTAVLLGAAVGGAVLLAIEPASPATPALAGLSVVSGAALLFAERRRRRVDLASPLAARVRGARLEFGPLRGRVVARRAGLLVALGLGLAAAGLSAAGAPALAVASVAAPAAAAAVVAELAERHLFFVAESARGMPGA